MPASPSKISIGIDCGSAACKGALLIDDEIAEMMIRPTGWSPKETSREVLQALLTSGDLNRDDVYVVATGYGRLSIDFADRIVTEITCHALGAEYILPGVRTVIDIGGQDSKAISVKDGTVASFQMNDKCAAGTGRFLEMSAHRMGVDLSEFADLLEARKTCSLSSMCAVFADSEIISLLASGKTREEIAGGVVHAIVKRALALTGKIEIEVPLLLTGGLAELVVLKEALIVAIGHDVSSSPLSRYAGAIGAAKMIDRRRT